MSKQGALDELGARVTKADVEAYTDVFYVDIEDSSLNGINSHSQRTDPHNISAIPNLMADKSAELTSVLDTKLDLDYPPYAAKVNVAGDEFTGPVRISLMGDALVLNSDWGNKREIVGQTADVQRWGIAIADQRDEIGGNAGSNFGILRYSDEGDLLGNPFGIDRKTGRVYVKRMQIADGPIIEADGLDIRLQSERPTLDLQLGTIWLNANTVVCTAPTTVNRTDSYVFYDWDAPWYYHTYNTTYELIWTNLDPGFTTGYGDLSGVVQTDWDFAESVYSDDGSITGPFVFGDPLQFAIMLGSWSRGSTLTVTISTSVQVYIQDINPPIGDFYLDIDNWKICMAKPGITRDFNIGLVPGGGGGCE